MKKFVVMMMAAATALFSAMGDTYTGGYTYAGLVYSSEMVPIGLATVKVAKATKAKTCKVMLQIQKKNQTKYSISGALNLNGDASGLTGTISAKGKGTWETEQIDTAHFEMVDNNTGILIQARRNYLEGVDAKAWSSKLTPFVGTWNGEFYTEDYGQALINCVVNNKGIVKIKTFGWKLAKTGYASVCTSKLVCEGSQNKCEIPVSFMKLTTKKDVSAAFNLILSWDLHQGTMSMKLDPNFPCYAIRTALSKTGRVAETKDEIVSSSFMGGKAANRPAGDYYIHGEILPLYPNPVVGDYQMFGLPLIATLSFPVFRTSLKVTRAGWLTPKATKITSATTLPVDAANESGIKVTNNSKTFTYKGSYSTYVAMGNRVKKFPAKFIGLSWRETYTGQLTDYLSSGYAFIKGPNGKLEYSYTCVDPMYSPDDDEDEGDE